MIDETPDLALLLPVVAIALTRADGRVLMARRPVGKGHAGLWEFPGGKIDPGERPEAALVREIREELGIDVAQAAVSPIGFASVADGNRHLLLLLYGATEWQGEPVALEASEIGWIEPAAMATLALPPGDRILVDALRRAIA